MKAKHSITAHSNEIVFAFVAPVGVDTTIASNAISERIREFGYETECISITRDILPKVIRKAKTTFPDEFTRIDTLMRLGTKARLSLGTDILAKGVALEISERRKSHKPNAKIAYLIRSVKHPDEVRCFREIYPRGFYLFAVNVPWSIRQKYLLSKHSICESNAEQLMQRDKTENVPHGQQVNQTFHLADFFIGWSDDERIRNSVFRFIDIIFGDPSKTPTFGEYAMFLAFAASLRSADLSRQVGAVIAKDNEILATGANDCPKAGGGLYWPVFDNTKQAFIDIPRGRDYTRGEDSNRKALLNIISEILKECKGHIPSRYIKPLKTILSASTITDLTEFGRVVHAEMETLLSCGRKGLSTKDATLYCTTFPCHNCAKHIIAAGIQRVVFVEPYLKSKAALHHDEVIKVDQPLPTSSEERKASIVRFEPFFGVGPRRFFDLFSMHLGVGRLLDRKDKSTGKTVQWTTAEASPRITILSKSYTEAEHDAAVEFKQALKANPKTSGLDS